MQHKSLPISRRNFLALSGAGIAALVASGCTANLQQMVAMEPYIHPPEETLPGEDVWFASTCRMCPAGCGIIVRTSNGRARKIEGNPAHPLNQGGLCARGQAGLQQLYHPDRLQQIQIRNGERGQGQWETASWNEVIDQITSIIQNNSPERIAFLTGLLPGYQAGIVGRFLDGLDAPDAIIYDTQTALDGRVVMAAASQALFGENALPVFDIGRADVVFGFGANFLETWLSPVSYNRAYGDMRSQFGTRGTFVAFEPRMSMTAANADRWVPVEPGMEGAVALALGRIIVDENMVHDGIPPEYETLYDDVDVAAIAGASGIEVEELTRLARIFADGHHPIALPGNTLVGYSNSLDAVKAVEVLNFVVGHTGEHGAMMLTPPAPARDFRVSPPNSFDDVLSLINRMTNGEVDTLFILGANPIYELPQAANFIAGLEQVENIITFATLPDETTALSDIVLPIHTYLETWGFEFNNPSTDKTIVSAQQPVVRPLYDTRDPADVLLALADQLGEDVKRRLPWPNLVNYIQTRLVSLQLEDGNITAPDSLDTFWAVWLQQGGWWSQESNWQVPTIQQETPLSLEVPDPVFDGNSDDFPFYLMPVPSVTFGDGRHAALPWLQETPDPMTTVSWDTWVELSPMTADQLALRNDDVVTVQTPTGTLQAVVYITPAIHPNVAAIPIGQGHTALGRWAQNRGANVLQILSPQTASNTGQLAWIGTRVQLVKTEERRQLPLMENPEGIENEREKSLLRSE